MKTEQAHIALSGVEALIERLKEQGMAAGQEKAENEKWGSLRNYSAPKNIDIKPGVAL